MSPRRHHTHSGSNVLCPWIGVLIKILLLFIGKSPNNKNVLVQAIGVLNRPQAFTWINTDPLCRYAYALLDNHVLIKTNKDIHRTPMYHDLTLNNGSWVILPMMITWSTHSHDHHMIIGYVNKLILWEKIWQREVIWQGKVHRKLSLCSIFPFFWWTQLRNTPWTEHVIMESIAV